MLKEILNKYGNVIPYLFFGVCTTLVNVVSYWICAYPLDFSIMTSTVLAWSLAVLFAYVTNRKWVFHGEARGVTDISKEMALFFACRLGTGLLDWLCMLIFAEWLGMDDVFVKAAADIAVIILNYLASKFVIFRKKPLKFHREID